jgi:hypothetical protein
MLTFCHVGHSHSAVHCSGTSAVAITHSRLQFELNSKALHLEGGGGYYMHIFIFSCAAVSHLLLSPHLFL